MQAQGSNGKDCIAKLMYEFYFGAIHIQDRYWNFYIVQIQNIRQRNSETRKEVNTIAIVPARGGSKRIPNKNIRLFYGQPIVSYSIKAAQATGIFDEIFYFDYSEQIASVSRENDASVYGLRLFEILDKKTGVLTVLAYELFDFAINMFIQLFYGRMYDQ